MNNKPIVPITFAANDGYVPYLGVAIESLIAHSHSQNEYHIYILHSNISTIHQERVEALSTENVTITFLDLSSKMEALDTYKTEQHFSAEATFRLFIPEVLPQYPKILYLDCDVIILEDVAQLLSFDVEGHVLGVANMASDANWKHRMEDILKVSVEDCFNSGVLLINTVQFLKENVRERCVKLLVEDWNKENPIYTLPDQDALTMVCRGKVKRFSMDWNFRWNMELPEKGIVPDLLPECIEEYETSKEQIKIVHYASKWKPWSAPELRYSDLFWKYAKESSFYEEILAKEMNFTVKRNEKINFSFPWEKVKVGSTIVIYGSGLVGQDYMKQLSQASYCFVAAVCDKNAREITGRPYRVVTPKTLLTMEFDLILIAIEKEEIVSLVKQELVALGVPEEKIC